MMGVPITFLDKNNPDQFEILGSSEGRRQTHEDLRPEGTRCRWRAHEVEHGEFGPPSSASKSSGRARMFDVGYPVRRIYKRLFIRRKDAS